MQSIGELVTLEVQKIPESALASIAESFASWDREQAAELAKNAEELRLEFLELFPLDVWPTLPIERYALGQQVEGGSFCWWLEFNTKQIASMSGGSSAKHLIFRGADGQWRFPTRYSTVEDAWSEVRAGFEEAFRLAEADQIDEIWGIEALYGAPALRTKALYMYFPEKFIPVCSFTHLHRFLSYLGQDYDTNWVLGTNVLLMRTLQSIPLLHGLSNQELGYFLYHWMDPREASQVVKIAPGEQGRFWEDCLSGGYICVGWDEVDDLRSYASKEEFRRAFSAKYASEYKDRESIITRKSNELWTLMTLAPGDQVIANRGITEILAVGTVTDSGYEFRVDRPEYRHTVSVDWDTSRACKINPVGAWRTTTVSKVSPAQYRRLFSGMENGADRLPPPATIDSVLLDVERALHARGQAILYGPPGTGKTFWALRAAVWLSAGGSAKPEASQVLSDPKWFSETEKTLTTRQLRLPRVWFMVSNPANWSWEELFEDGYTEYSYGRIQNHFPEVAVGDLVFGYESAPTSRVVAVARVTQGYQPEIDPDHGLTLEPVEWIESGLDFATLKADPLVGLSEPVRFQCQGTLFALTEAEAHRLLQLSSDSNPYLKDTLTSPAAQLTRVTFHPSYTYEDFIEGFRPSQNAEGGLELQLADGVFKKVCTAAATDPKQPYVILIDEINRGNIAKIFGELITLLELDKRGLTATLPQSGEQFSVPPNVFIIGTMNTADRSIQLLDTAVRRRFRFIELMPDSDTLEGGSIAGLLLPEFLDQLNEMIRRKVGRERQIGHAVLFQGPVVVSSPEAFAEVFRHEILPMVQEYLYDNYADLADVFGANIIDASHERVAAGAFDDPVALCGWLAEQFDAAST